MPKKLTNIAIFDTTLRDGEQSPGASLNVPQKLEVARQLAKLRVDIIEAGFPASSPGDFEAVATISKEIRDVVVCGLTRAKREDIDIAYEALRGAASPRIHTGLGVSDVHLQHKLRRTREQALEMGVAAVRHARKLVGDVEYFLEDAGRADLDYLCEVVEAVIKAGATVINIPDTTGYSYPEEWGARIRRVCERVPNADQAVISVHCHNDLGLATANALAGIANGARQVECTINGIGERAGNTSLEEVVMALATRRDLYAATTRIKTPEIYKTSRLVSDLMGIPVAPNKAIVGGNAFAHSSGIHQDGVLKERTTYEIIDPRAVGIPESRIVLTARSGRHGLRHRLNQLGYGVSDDQFEQVYQRFLGLADKKKEVFEEDLESIVADELHRVPEVYQLDYLHVVAGSGTVPSATVRLLREGQEITAAALGVGPIDAVYKAIDSLIVEHHRLVDFSVRSVTGGTDALGEVYVRLADDQGREFSGRGSSTDIIDAGAKAYLQALNRLAGQEGRARLRAAAPSAKSSGSSKSGRTARPVKSAKTTRRD